MKQECGVQGCTLQPDEIDKYDINWKQDIVLSECEDQYIQIVSENEDELTQTFEKEKIIQLKELDEIVDDNVLLYLDSPQLKMSSLSTIQNVVNYFLSNDLIVSFTNLTNKHLQNMFQEQSEAVYKKKIYKTSEIQIYFGLQIVFGICKLPDLKMYWEGNSWLKGGIEICIPQGRFQFVHSHFCFIETTFPQESLQVTKQLDKLPQKISNLYNPDQELILAQIQQSQYDVYYLFDFQTFMILNFVIIENTIEIDERKKKILKMLLHYRDQNHVIYIDILFQMELEWLCQLVDLNIFPVVHYTDYNHHLLSSLENKCYVINQLVIKKENNDVILYPLKSLISKRSYTQTLENIQVSIREFTLLSQLMRSDFYLSQDSYGKKSNDDRIKFIEYFEIMIHNTSILLQKPSQKKYRSELALHLLGEKGQIIERNRRFTKKKLVAGLKSVEVNTEFLEFGLENVYGKEFHTPIPQSRDEAFKYCLVCMRFDGITKPFYRCHQCENLLKKGKIFLCTFPCFELFHKNPNDYVNTPIEQDIESFGEGKFFLNESTVDMVRKELLENEEPKKKRGNKAPPRAFWSQNRQKFAQDNPDDPEIQEMVDQIAKPIMPNPSQLKQILITNDNQQEDQSLEPKGHKKDFYDIERRIDQEREDKERQIIEGREKEQQQIEYLRRRINEEKEKKQQGRKQEKNK